MKKYVILLILFMTALCSYSSPDDIVGVWREDKGSGKTEFYKVGEYKYEGRCVWLKNNVDKDGGALKDRKNPDKQLRTRAIVGSHVMTLTYDPAKKRYNMDWAYDPSLGIAASNTGYFTISGDTITIKAGWAFIRITKYMYRE